MRNDSSGVADALCPDYFALSPKRISISAPNMAMQRRLLLSSFKKKEDQIQYRKPLKECYCNRLNRKIQYRSIRTKIKETPCSHCRSLVDLRPMAWVESNDFQQTEPKPSLSCETVRRVQKVNYSPQSEFLQNKVSSTHNILNGRSSNISSKSTFRCLPKYSCSTDEKVQYDYKPLHTISKNISLNTDNASNCEPEVRKSVEFSKKSSLPRHVSSQINNEFKTLNKTPSRETIEKRTISSKKVSPSSKDELSKKTKSYSTSNGRSRYSQSKPIKENQGLDSYYGKCYLGKYDMTPKYSKEAEEISGQRSRTSKNRDKRQIIDNDVDNNLINLYKFREKNYFDTHGSAQSILSSCSSGSLEHYLLNERLFPQPAGKIHRGDLVVTMPPCATKQRKRIHYFPRFSIKQGKNNNETSCGKKKHCFSCPLTGHAIDVGTLKTCHPSNSLALRFQKGVP